MEKQYNYTVIIPHYKIIDLLGRALASIPDREDIQILVVDDNSGIEKCKFEKLNNFQKANCKFIFTYKSGGAGYVRNEGLTRALGKWLLFLDADDFFEKNAFNIFDKYMDSDNDIIYFNTTSVYSETLKVSDRFGLYHSYIDFVNPNIEEHLNIIRCSHVVPIAKMIKLCLVKEHNILFDEIRWGNDVMFATKIGVNAKKVWVDKNIVYVVTERMGSLVKQISIDSMLLRYEVALRANKYLRQQGFVKYQNTILFHLRRIASFGFICLLKAFLLGFKYNGYNIYSLYRAPKLTKKIIKLTKKI